MINKPFLLNNPVSALLCLFMCAYSACRSAGALQSPSSVNTGLYDETRRRDSLLARKYAAMLHTTPAMISSSLPLYRYIDRYLNTPFSKTPSDRTLNDVLLVQRLYDEVYHKKTPGTYQELYQSKLIPKFTDTAYLAEGDLLFFEEKKGYMPPVKNVGVYLQQGRFLSCTAYTGGVTINDLTQTYWQQRYRLAGRLR
jgi:hypothetical protein